METYMLLPWGYPGDSLGLPCHLVLPKLCFYVSEKSYHSNHILWYKFIVTMLECRPHKNKMILAIFLLEIYERLQSNSSSKVSMMFHPNYVDQMTSLAMNVQCLSSRKSHQNKCLNNMPEVKYQLQGWETTYYHKSGWVHGLETDDIGWNCIQTKAIPLRYWQCCESIESVTMCPWRWLGVQQ